MSDSILPDDFEVTRQIDALISDLDNKDNFEKRRDDFDDSLLSGRIKSYVATPSEDSFDPQAESKEEEKTAILQTIIRQFGSGNPSKEALLFAASGFAKYVETGNGIDSLDNAFFPKPKLDQGGQKKNPYSPDRLKVCAVYQNVIFQRTIKYEKDGKGEVTPVYTELTREILSEAKLAAITAYNEKELSKRYDYSGKFKQTIKPILEEGGVYISPNELRKKSRGE